MPRRNVGLEKTWTAKNINFAAQAAGSVAATLFTPTDRSTLLRMRGTVTGWADATQAPGKSVFVTMGIILVPLNTGTTVLVDPFGEPSASWIWWYAGFIGYEEMVTDVIDVPGITSFRHDIDSKAMRKLYNDVELQLVMTNTTASSAMAVNVSTHVRILVQA